MTNNLPKPPRKKVDLPKLKKLAQSIREDMTPNNLQEYLEEILYGVTASAIASGMGASISQQDIVDEAFASIQQLIQTEVLKGRIDELKFIESHCHTIAGAGTARLMTYADFLNAKDDRIAELKAQGGVE